MSKETVISSPSRDECLYRIATAENLDEAIQGFHTYLTLIKHQLAIREQFRNLQNTSILQYIYEEREGMRIVF